MFGLNYDMARMAQIIRVENPDIIALQEYAKEQQERLHSRIVAQYPYFKLCAGRKRSYVALYAKIPFDIIEGTQCALDPDQDNNPAARILARFGDAAGTEFVFATTHLNWPVQINPLFNEALSFGQKLHAMTARKQTEWQELSNVLNNIELPVIITGDLNSTSWSYALRHFVKSTNLIRHSRGLLTFPKLLYIGGWRETPAFLPLDHVMASNSVLVHDIRAGPQTGSDHLPLYADFSIKPAQ
jgi:endonuclease/exonuclease/phosphatase (EEP) superfamily protein YafD